MNHLKNLVFPETEISPYVNLDAENGIVELSGKALPEDADAFFNPILEWIDNYSISGKNSLEVSLKFDFLNIASSKRILFLLYKCNDMHENNVKVLVNWYYPSEDRDMMEIGRDYAFMTQPLYFRFISVSEQMKLKAG